MLRTRLLFGIVMLVLARPFSLLALDDWQPITPEELKMTADPAHPTDAVILYHEETYDDNREHMLVYLRLKILTQSGRDRATVVLPYREGFGITDVKARTISPDGTITPMNDKPFDTTVRKGRGRTKVRAKSFTMPNVQVGSIIEYKYAEYWERWAISPHWTVQEDLPTLRARFTFVPYSGSGDIIDRATDEILNRVYYYTSGNVPKDASIKRTPDNKMELEMKNIPAFQEEDLAPPSDLLTMRVDFYYGTDKMAKPDDFWKNRGKFWNKQVDKFIGHSSEVAAAAKGAVAPSDTPEQKARKIFALVQAMRNRAYVTGLSLEDAQSRDKKKEDDAEDILKRKSGNPNDLTRLFLAMARDLEIPAYLMRVSSRDKTFFQKDLADWRQLTDEIVIVRLADGKEIFLDPGTPHCPFGLLDWKHNNEQGIRQTPDGGTALANTPQAAYSQAMTQRIARLTLASDGSLSGKIKMVWTGQEALSRRIGASRTDEAGRKKDLEDDVAALLPKGAVVKMDASAGWDNPDVALQATFNVEMQSFASVTGKRLLFPSGIFEVSSKPLFTQAERKYPVYLSYPYRMMDDVQITLPADFKVENLPQTPPINTDFAVYRFQRTLAGNSVNMTRDFAIAGVGFPVQYYPELRQFFGGVTAGDGQQIVLTTSK